MSLVIAIDFDGTLVEDRSPLVFRPGAKEALVRLRQHGHSLILHSARCTWRPVGTENPNEAGEFWQTGRAPPWADDVWARFDEMRTFLQQQGVWELFDKVWQDPGKPLADVFIDDRAVVPYWPVIVEEYAPALEGSPK